MMAGHDGVSTCEVLLQKLRQGQNELRRSLRTVQTSSDGERRRDGTREMAVHFHQSPMRNVTRKRARTVLLSPHPTPPSTPLPKRKLHRRLSSTPKDSTAPPLDLSLEEAVFSEGIVTSRPHKKGEKRGKESGHGEIVDDQSISSERRPRLSQVDVRTPGSGVKKRGLSVSFVQDSHTDTHDESLSRSKDYTAKRDLGTSLIQSLNSSRFGALDRRLSQMRKTRTFPRKYKGDDPRLGYDWIAGLLDVESAYLVEEDDEYYEEIKEFRRVNTSECFRPKEALLPGSSPRMEPSDDDGHHSSDTTCVSSYVLNDRLFPVPIHQSEPGSHCPVCEGGHKPHPSPPHYIKVSVPRSSLVVPYQVRPHRRRSFNSTDSMGLSQHCQAGWETAQPSIVPPQPPIDLKSSLTTEASSLTSRRGGDESRDLLNTSLSVEYNLRSRRLKKYY